MNLKVSQRKSESKSDSSSSEREDEMPIKTKNNDKPGTAHNQAKPPVGFKPVPFVKPRKTTIPSSSSSSSSEHEKPSAKKQATQARRRHLRPILRMTLMKRFSLHLRNSKSKL